METAGFTLNELKRQDPEKYFQEVLEVSEFNELKTLAVYSLGQMSWEKLIEEGVVKIEGKKVEGIYWKGDLDFKRTSIKSFRKLKKVRGDIDCEGQDTLEDLGELEEVGGKLHITNAKIKSLGKLKKVGAGLYCQLSNGLEDLGELEEVGGKVDLSRTSVESLGKLKKVGGDLACPWLMKLNDLGELEEVGGFFNVRGTRIKSLGKLKKVGGDMNCEGVMSLEDLGGLEEVGGDMNIKYIPIELQIQAFLKQENLELYVGQLLIEDILKDILGKLYIDGEDIHDSYLDNEDFYDIFGEKLESIDEQNLESIAIEILSFEYNKKRNLIIAKIQEIITEGKKKELTSQDKKAIKNEIKLLDDKLKKLKEKRDSFLMISGK